MAIFSFCRLVWWEQQGKGTGGVPLDWAHCSSLHRQTNICSILFFTVTNSWAHASPCVSWHPLSPFPCSTWPLKTMTTHKCLCYTQVFFPVSEGGSFYWLLSCLSRDVKHFHICKMFHLWAEWRPVCHWLWGGLDSFGLEAMYGKECLTHINICTIERYAYSIFVQETTFRV